MPQNLKTDAIDLDELPPLSAEEERLVELVANGTGNSEAYRLAYGANGYNANSLAVKASRKIAEPKIQAHLSALRSVGLAKIGLSYEDRIKDELAFAQRAESAGNFGAAGQARDRINKLAGLYVEKVQDITDHDPQRTLRQIAEVQPELADQLAVQHGIDWKPNEGATKH
jgi:hypothetical protein